MTGLLVELIAAIFILKFISHYFFGNSCHFNWSKVHSERFFVVFHAFLACVGSAKYNRISVKLTEKVVVECRWSQKKLLI